MTIDSADDSKISNRTINTNRISNRTYDSKSNRITKLRRSLANTLHALLKTTNIAELWAALLQYGMICHRSSLMRQSCHFERHFDLVLLQLADTLSTLKTKRAADIHYWNVWSVDEKVVQTLIRYYSLTCMLTSKSELKFKLLYLLNQCYFTS